MRKEKTFHLLMVVLMYVLVIALEVNLKVAHSDEVHVVVVESYQSRVRADVGSVQYLAFRCVWSTNASGVQGATVFVNGVPHRTAIDGWVFFGVKSDIVTKKEWHVDKIVYYGMEIAFVQNIDNPTMIWDCVNVDLRTNEERIGVGSEADIYWSAHYEFDGRGFDGEIFLNDSQLRSDSICRKVFTVEKIIDSEFRLSAFRANELAIIWDVVNITLIPPREMIDVGSDLSIAWVGRYEYDKSNFTGSVTLNVSSPVYDVGRRRITVRAIFDPLFQLSVFTSNTVEVVFNMVDINLTIADDRVSIGDSVDVSWSGRYALDKTPFRGSVLLNDTTFQLWEVGRKGYKTSKIIDPEYGLSVFSSNEVYSIWDRVNITLSAEDTRIDVGKPVRIITRAIYEYDLKNFTDVEFLKLNDDAFIQDHIGLKEFEVVAMNDTVYGLTVFVSNRLSIIWDRIDLTITVPYSRCAVDASPSVHIFGTHAFDGTSFEGTAFFNESLTKNSIGKYSFTVEKISDPLYGLSGFSSNDFTVIYDEIVADVQVSSILPRRIDVSVMLSYLSDGVPVDDAIVRINEKEARLSNGGLYKYRIKTLSPVAKVRVEVQRPDFNTIIMKKTEVSFGNITLICILFIALMVFIHRKIINQYLKNLKRDNLKNDLKSINSTFFI